MIIKSISEISKDDINGFSCGNKELDTYFIKYSLINDNNGYGKTFVLLDEDHLIGFFTLCSSSIKFDELPKNMLDQLPKYPIPCIKIARLAVNKTKQGNGYGKELLKQALLRIYNVTNTIGVKLVTVDVKDSSIGFYEKFGFSRLLSNKSSYYLLIETLKKAIENETK